MSRHLISIEIQRETAEKLLKHYQEHHDVRSPLTQQIIDAIELALGRDDG